jgi:hypothetical protein
VEVNQYKDCAADLKLMGDVIEIVANTFEYMIQHINNKKSQEVGLYIHVTLRIM